MVPFAASPLGALISLVLGLLGLIIGVGGFALTLLQLSRVKRASQAQEEAISSLRIRLASFDAIQECAHAQGSLDVLRSAIASTDIKTAIKSYDKLAISFISLAESSALEFDTTNSLRQAAQRIGKISTALEKDAGSHSIQTAKHLDISRDFHSLLMQVRFKLHREQ